MDKRNRSRNITTNVVDENRHALVGIERARRYRGILGGQNKETQFVGSDSVFRRQNWPFVTLPLPVIVYRQINSGGCHLDPDLFRSRCACFCGCACTFAESDIDHLAYIPSSATRLATVSMPFNYTVLPLKSAH